MILRRSSLIVSLILLYVFLAPLGLLARFGQEEGSYGVTTILLILIVLVSLNVSIKVVQRHRDFQGFGLLILWILMAFVFAPEPLPALINGGTLVLYWLAAMAAFYYIRDETTALRLLTVLCLGGLLGATATIIDFVGLVNIPGVNELSFGTRTELERIVQASGVFPRRSAMAVYYSLIITGGILLPLICRRLSVLRKTYFYSAAVMCLIVLMLSHNRAGVLASLLAMGIILISSARSPVRIMKLLAAVGLLGVLVAYIVTVFFPDIWIAYQALLGVGQVASSDPSLAESDSLRLVFFRHTLTSVLSNPFGHGYSLLSDVIGYEGRLVDPHNIISQVIWASGLFGIVWLGIFGFRAVVQGVRLLRVTGTGTTETNGQVTLVIFGVLLAFMLVGMTHTTINTGIAWILFGVLARMASNLHPQGSVWEGHTKDCSYDL